MSLYHHRWLSYHSWCGWCLANLKTTRHNICWLTGNERKVLEVLYRSIFCECLSWTSCLNTIKGKKGDVHILYFYVHVNFLNVQFFLIGDICFADYRMQGLVVSIPKQLQGWASNNEQLFSIWTSSDIVGKRSIFPEIQ